MSVWTKIRGTIESVFQLGLGGPQWKANGGAIEARDSGDAAFAVVRGAAAVASNDLAILSQLGTLSAPVTETTRVNSAGAVYTIDVTGGGADGIIQHNRSGATTYILPAVTAGRLLVLEDVTGAIQTPANNVFLVPAGSETINGSSGFVLSGGATFNFTNGSPNVTATGSAFTKELAVGMALQSSNQPGVNYIVASITSDSLLALTANFSGTTTATATATRTSVTFAANFGALTCGAQNGNWRIKGDGTQTKVSFTGAGTLILPPGVTLADFLGAGGGGGGAGGGRCNGGSTQAAGGGGGGGAAIEKLFRGVSVSGNVAYAVTPGAGGAHGAGSVTNNTAGANGSNGASSTVGTLGLTWVGGSGGQQGGTAAGGSGGAAFAGARNATTNLSVVNNSGTGGGFAAVGGAGGTGGAATTGASGSAGNLSDVGGFAGGAGGSPGTFTATDGSGAGGGGGGAGPRGAGGSGGNGGAGVAGGTGGNGTSGGAVGANTGAGGGGGGGGGAGATSGNGGDGIDGGSGYVDVVYTF